MRDKINNKFNFCEKAEGKAEPKVKIEGEESGTGDKGLNLRTLLDILL
jgi:hypothetical protein